MSSCLRPGCLIVLYKRATDSEPLSTPRTDQKGNLVEILCPFEHNRRWIAH